MFFASLTRGNPDPKSPVCEWTGTQATSESTWDTPVPSPTSRLGLGPNSRATGKHIQERGILSHLGRVDLQILSNILQDVYLTVC